LTHTEILEYLDEYDEGQLSSDLYDTVDSHLKECSACRQRLQIIRAQKAALKEEELSVPDLASWASSQTWTREKDPPVSPRRFLRMNRFASIAAALILVVGLGIIGILSQHSFSNASKAAPESAEANAYTTEYALEGDSTAETFALTEETYSGTPDGTYDSLKESKILAAGESNNASPSADTSESEIPESSRAAGDDLSSPLNSVLSAEEAAPADAESSGESDADAAPMVLGARREAPRRRTGLWFAIAVLAIGITALAVWRIRKGREYRSH